MKNTKEQFIETIKEHHIHQTLENMEWYDLMAYYWPTFDMWLDMHEISAHDKDLLYDYFDLNHEWESIQFEHASGFYSVHDDQYILLIDHEQEDTIGAWFSNEQIEWINEEFTVDSDYFYIYNPTAFFITIQTVNAWLEKNRYFYED